MNVFQLEILACDKTFFTGEAEMIIIPSLDGEQGILPNHQPMVSAIEAGEIRVKINGEWHKAFVGSGIAQVIDNKVTLLFDSVERPEDIDVKRAEEALIRAEEQLRQQQSIIQYHQSKASLARAMSRLRVAKKYDKY